MLASSCLPRKNEDPPIAAVQGRDRRNTPCVHISGLTTSFSKWHVVLHVPVQPNSGAQDIAARFADCCRFSALACFTEQCCSHVVQQCCGWQFTSASSLHSHVRGSSLGDVARALAQMMCRGLLSQPGMRCLWSSYRRTTAATTSACTLSTSSGAGLSHCFTAELTGVS